MSSYVNDFSETTKAYLKDLENDKYEPIPKAIEEDLFRKYKEGDKKAFKQLVDAHLRLVVNLAKRYKRINTEISDLISEGNLGLITAIERFNPDMGVRLCVYAKCWIIKSMIETITRNTKLNENETPIDEIITNEKNTDKSGVLYDSYDPQEETQTVDFEVDDDEKKHCQEIVESLLETLDERSRFVIENYYGLNDHDQLSINEISDELGISTERVRQIKSKAMILLRSQALVQNISSKRG